MDYKPNARNTVLTDKAPLSLEQQRQSLESRRMPIYVWEKSVLSKFITQVCTFFSHYANAMVSFLTFVCITCTTVDVNKREVKDLFCNKQTTIHIYFIML